LKPAKDIHAEIEKYKDYLIIVEGKKDINALKSLGFQNVHAIHKTSVTIRERAEQISSYLTKKDKLCILTDLDKKGKKLYIILKPIFQELGAHLDSSLRAILIKSKLSHIEGLPKFLEKLEAN
jgi:5S rRNA maturation endonuclease (ribonuclease M5)